MEWQRGAFSISTDRQKLDRSMIHEFLHDSYWARGISRELVERSIDHALCFGLYEREKQVGFARIITDYATFAYLADVFILESYRGRGLATWLVEVILGHPDLQGLRRWMLVTKDAQTLYRKVGFTPVSKPDWIMERLKGADIYVSPGGH